MIEVRTNRESFAYDIHSLIQAFFPGEQVVVREKEAFTEDTPLRMCALIDDGRIYFAIYEDGSVSQEGSVPVENPDRKALKNSMKKLMYQQLSAFTGHTLPWGSLTGIRPVKIPMLMLDEGKSDGEIAAYMADVYSTGREKTDLAISIAHREREILSRLDYKEGYSLYIGIPFCPSICLYCSFSSSPISRWEKRVDEYLAALFKELKFLGEACAARRLNTIYIGGGTPTTLSADQLEKLFCCIEENFSFTYLKEFTVEAGRPDSITPEKLRVIKSHPVTRISVNPQTMNQKTLDIIGRKHTVEETRGAFYLAREAGFDNINMDLIVGLPGEDIDDVRYSMEELEKLAPENITVHSLAVKRAARLKLFRDTYEEMGIKNSEEIMDLTRSICRRQGLYPYYLYRQKNMAGNLENVGYAKEGREGLYNILIMEEKQSIIAAGAGGASKFVLAPDHIERVENVKDVAQYIDRIDEMIERKKTFMDAHEWQQVS